MELISSTFKNAAFSDINDDDEFTTEIIPVCICIQSVCEAKAVKKMSCASALVIIGGESTSVGVLVQVDESIFTPDDPFDADEYANSFALPMTSSCDMFVNDIIALLICRRTRCTCIQGVSAKMLQTSRRGRGQQDDSKCIGNAGSELLSPKAPRADKI
ncbi:hypothetical protein TNCV_3684051 [Trichonephila clavipes]|nr:hypothetical protein TNCV_3684051 [Trichonephila clavipes]